MAQPQPQEAISHSHHAEPGHVHHFLPTRQYVTRQTCIYCHVEETLALRAENGRLQRRVQELEAAMLAIYRLPPRVNGARYGGLASAKEIASTQIALSQWHDNEQTN